MRRSRTSWTRALLAAVFAFTPLAGPALAQQLVSAPVPALASRDTAARRRPRRRGG